VRSDDSCDDTDGKRDQDPAGDHHRNATYEIIM